MEDNKSMEVFAKAPIRKAALQNALPAMAAMLMVLIYNLADTFSPLGRPTTICKWRQSPLLLRFFCCLCLWERSSVSAASR